MRLGEVRRLRESLWLLDVNWLLLGCQQAVHGSRHRLHVNLFRDETEDIDITRHCHRGTMLDVGCRTHRKAAPIITTPVPGGTLRTRLYTKPRVYVEDVTRPYLTNCIGQDVYNLLMRSRHNALAIDLDDTVTNANTTSFSYPPSHKAANLTARQEHRKLKHAEWNDHASKRFAIM